MRNISSLIILLILMIGCNTSHSQEEKKIVKSFEGIESIDLNTASGDCEIKKGSGSTVVAEITYTYDDEDFTPEMEKMGSILKLEEKFHGNNVRGKSKWVLSVPDGLEIGFNTGSGSLLLGNLQGEVEFNSGSGDAHVEDFEGELKFNSGSGSFYYDKVKGEIKANSGSGDHHIFSSEMHMSANTGSGDIEVRTSKGGFKLNSGSGDVEAGQLVLMEEGNFNTGSGDVEISLAASLENDISANSGSGNAVLDFNGNAIEGEVIMTCKKQGGNIKAPFKFDKEEEIDRDGEVYLKKTARLGSKDILIEVGTGTGTAEIRQ